MGFKLKTWQRAALIVLAGCWVFSPVLHGPWLWDDDLYITQNLLLRSAAGLGKIWFAPPGVNYFPLTFTVQWLEWHLWGVNPVGYHCVNIGLHLLSAFLLWRVLFKLRVPQAWLGGLIFAIHPLTVESVAWISELKNTLSLPLLLLAILSWIDCDRWSELPPTRSSDPAKEIPLSILPNEARSGQHAPPWNYYFSILFFLAAMLCKSTVVMFPFVLLLHAWWKRGKLGRIDLKRAAPFFAVSLVLGVVTLWFEHHRSMAGLDTAAPGGLFSRVANAGLAVVFYFSKCVVPRHLSLIYAPWTPDPLWRAQLFAWLAILAVVFGLLIGRTRLRSAKPRREEARALRRQPAISPAAPAKKISRDVLFGVGFFLLNLIPVLGIVPMAYAHISWVADHFAYVPLVGIVGLAAAGFGNFFEQEEREDRKRSDDRKQSLPGLPVLPVKKALMPWLVVLAVVAALAIEAHRYATVFSNGVTLWNYTVQRSPDSMVAHNNLGLVLAEAGRLPEAIVQYDEALRLKPDSAEVEANLGLALASSGQREEAIARYRAALKLNPGQPGIHNNLCIVLRQTGRIQEAIAEGREALRLRPDYAEADNNLGAALVQAGRISEAIACFDRALRLQPDYAEAHHNLGLAFLLSHRVPEAIAQEREALRIDPASAHAHYGLGLVLAATGRRDEAIGELEQSVKLNPNDADARLVLGRMLFQAGRIAEGKAQLDAAARLRAAAPQ